MKLEELAIGKSAVILSVGGEGALRQHFLDMGLIQACYFYFVPLLFPLRSTIVFRKGDYSYSCGTL